MLELNINQAGEKVVVTLTELQTLNEPYFLFIFTHVLTKAVVNLIKAYEEDESDYPERYNQFDINTSVVFLNQPPGEWHYRVYEQVSSTNEDPALTAGLLENGKLILYPVTGFEFTQYEQETSFKTYNG